MSMPSSAVLTPMFEPSRALSATSAACSSALVGMQPRCRHVPPSLSRSTRATDSPSSAARKAQADPPLPPAREGAGVPAAAPSEDHDIEDLAGAVGHVAYSLVHRRAHARAACA